MGPLMVPDNQTMPLSRWTNFGSYDTAKECADDRAKQVQLWASGAMKGMADEREIKAAVLLSACFETDDPRLNGN
jgi:hypothetical protein